MPPAARTRGRSVRAESIDGAEHSGTVTSVMVAWIVRSATRNPPGTSVAIHPWTANGSHRV